MVPLPLLARRRAPLRSNESCLPRARLPPRLRPRRLGDALGDADATAAAAGAAAAAAGAAAAAAGARGCGGAGGGGLA